MAGRLPKPTAIRVLEGRTGSRYHQRDPALEPRPAAGIGKPPGWLNAGGRKEWDRVVPALEEIGLLTQVDTAALAMYCQAWGRICTLERRVNRFGLTMTIYGINKAGESVALDEKERPEVAMIRKERLAIKGLLGEFGLSPASRGRMSLPTKPPAGSEMDDLLG